MARFASLNFYYFTRTIEGLGIKANKLKADSLQQSAYSYLLQTG
jgi:hypothetical protein